MRQAGILAAAGIYALEHHVARLVEDHEHARRLAQGLQKVPGISVHPEHVETNIVVFEVADQRRSPSQIVTALRNLGVLINAVGAKTYRAVTHLDVGSADIERAGEIFKTVLSN